MKQGSRAMAMVVAAMAALVGSLAMGTRAQALSPNEKYVTRVYQDFLLRDPTTAELSAGVTKVSSSRSAFVSSVFASSSFRKLWILATQIRYTSSPPSAAQASTQLAGLNANDNFLSIEADDLGGTRYWTNAGSTNDGFLQELYQDVLNRAPDPSGQTYWLGRLANGVTPRTVASTLLRSNEAAALRTAGPSSATSCAATAIEGVGDLVAGSYCLVLDRMADPSGKTYWTTQLAASGQLPGLWQSLATSNEYFNLTQA